MYFKPLNFIRFLLAFGVVLFHYGVKYYPFDTPLLKTFILNSGFRVSFFFFISGFVMTLVYGPQIKTLSPFQFYKKRVTRIFPIYWFAFVLTLLLVLFVNHSAPKGLVVILHALGLQSMLPGYVLDLNYPTWSISVELFFYALFPFVLKWLMKQNMLRLFYFTAAVWFIQSLQHILFVQLLPYSKHSEEFINAFPIWHLGTFFVGMFSAKLILEQSIPPGLQKKASLVFVLSTLLFLCLIFIPNPVLKYIHNGLISPLFAVFVISLFYDASFMARVLSLQPLSRLGDLSYGLFIFQYPVWIVYNSLIVPSFVESKWYFTLYFISLLIFSWFINRFVEKPLLIYLRKESPDKAVKI